MICGCLGGVLGLLGTKSYFEHKKIHYMSFMDFDKFYCTELVCNFFKNLLKC